MSIAQGSRIGNYPYRIIKQLGVGEGGMSEIYSATIGKVKNPTAKDMVVVKIVNIEEQNRDFFEATLQNEVETLRRLGQPGHPGVVELLPIRGPQVGNRAYTALTKLPGNPWFFVMEYLAGGTLSDLITQNNKLDISFAIQVVWLVNDTLAYIHRQGFVHLDIKPENILFRKPLEQGIEPVLIDFGISRGIGQRGLEAGTLVWCSPERIAATLTSNLTTNVSINPEPPMDVYALGMVLYNMVTGRLPFQKISRKRTTEAILQGNPLPPSTHNQAVVPELDELIMAMIAKEPQDRPTTAQLATQLGILARKYPVDPALLSKFKKKSKSRRSSCTLTLILIAMLLLAGSGFLWSGRLHPYIQQIASTVIVPVPTQTAVPTQTSKPTATLVPTIPPTKKPNQKATATPRPTIQITSTTLPTSTPLLPTSTPQTGQSDNDGGNNNNSEDSSRNN